MKLIITIDIVDAPDATLSIQDAEVEAVPAQPSVPAANPPEASEPPKPRGRPRKVTAAPSAAPAPAPAAEEASPPAASPDTTPPAVGSVTAPDKVYTEQDVRNALVNLQSVLGNATKSKEILHAHSPTKVISGIPKEQYGEVVKACVAALPQ